MAAPKVYDIGDSIELFGYFTQNNTIGAVDAGSTALTVQDATGYAGSDAIIVYGAGDVGGDLITAVSSVSGNTITLAATAKTSVIRAQVGELVAGTVTCTVRKPDGTSSTPSVSNLGTGRYKATFDAETAGQHFYRFASTGSVKAGEEREFVVRERRVS